MKKQLSARCAGVESMPAGTRSPQTQHGNRAPIRSSTAPTAIFSVRQRRKQQNNNTYTNNITTARTHGRATSSLQNFSISVVVVIVTVVMMVMVPYRR